jgi:hypothetical protein
VLAAAMRLPGPSHLPGRVKEGWIAAVEERARRSAVLRRAARPATSKGSS